jgi:DNA mismatch repair ATPase MutL
MVHIITSQTLLSHFHLIGSFKFGFLLLAPNDPIQNDVLLIIDQHAADERIQLERICHDTVLGANEDEKLAACMAAVKVTERSSEEQQRGIVERMGQCQFPFACAHGRPTVVGYTLQYYCNL